MNQSFRTEPPQPLLVKEGSRVLILGLGQYPKGSGVSAALFFARQGADVTVTDQKSAKDLAGNVAQLKKFKNVRFVLGKHLLKDVRDADIIVPNPRVRPDSTEMKLAHRLGKRVESDVSIFMSMCPCPIIAVTGTRGKSTTSTLIAEMLKKDGKRRVWLGGNILVSPLTFLSDVKKDDIIVLELSSWQLETVGVHALAPHIAVFTNLMRDHLNTYDSMEQYAEAKAQVFRHQKPDDVVILNANDDYGKMYMHEAPSNVLSFGMKPGARHAWLTTTSIVFGDAKIDRKKIKLLGVHSLYNIMAAGLAARADGASIGSIRSVATTFVGIPDRMETIGTIKGVRYVNDTTATTPDATIAAIRSFAPTTKRIHLLAGGADKELEFDEVAREIKRHRVCVSLFEGTAFKKYAAALKKVGVPFEEVSSMRDAVTFHQSHSKAGDTILLSPGCASFGLFKNEFDRGEQFKSLLK